MSQLVSLASDLALPSTLSGYTDLNVEVMCSKGMRFYCGLCLLRFCGFLKNRNSMASLCVCDRECVVCNIQCRVYMMFM